MWKFELLRDGRTVRDGPWRGNGRLGFWAAVIDQATRAESTCTAGRRLSRGGDRQAEAMFQFVERLWGG
jgi:hypothetical protein